MDVDELRNKRISISLEFIMVYIKFIDFNKLAIAEDDFEIDGELFFNVENDNEVIEYLLNLPGLEHVENPIFSNTN